MKYNNILFLIILFITFCLTSCFQSKESKACDQLISEIGNITLQSEKAINDAEKAYTELSDKDRKTLKNYQVLLQARDEYNQLIDENNASIVENLIDSIGIVTIDAEDKIKKARDQYNKQTKKVKELIKNINKLTEAEFQYSQIRINNVNELINSIVVQKTGKKFYDTLKPALDSYNQLTDKEKENIDVTKLKDFLSQYKQIKKSNKTKLKKEHDAMKQRTFYTSWSAPQNYMQCFICPYISSKDGGGEVLVIEYNYVSGSSWLYVKKADLLIDEKERFEINLPNVTRDVIRPYGGIIEYADLVATNTDVEMLWKMANSKETQVRYTGSYHYKDFWLDSSDFYPVKQVLEAYDALQDYYVLFGL